MLVHFGVFEKEQTPLFHPVKALQNNHHLKNLLEPLQKKPPNRSQKLSCSTLYHVFRYLAFLLPAPPPTMKIPSSCSESSTVFKRKGKNLKCFCSRDFKGKGQALFLSNTRNKKESAQPLVTMYVKSSASICYTVRLLLTVWTPVLFSA